MDLTDKVTISCGNCLMNFISEPTCDLNLCVLCRLARKCGRCGIAMYSLDLSQSNCMYCRDRRCYVSEILNGDLYISDYQSSLNYPLLHKIGIRQILTIGKELTPHETKEFKTMYISLDDAENEPIRDHFDSAHDFILRGPTLVHCYAGISRSATLVLSYLIKYYNFSLDSALEHCRKRRPIINPNAGFIDQLAAYEKEMIEKDFGEIFKLELNSFDLYK